MQLARLALQFVPRKFAGVILAGVGFAMIGVVATTRFCIDSMADGIAYFSNTSRKEEWAPVVFSTVFFMLITHNLLSQLMRSAPTDQVQSTQNPLAFLQGLAQQSNRSNVHVPAIASVDNEKAKKPKTEEPKPSTLEPKSEFDKNLRRAGAALFALPANASSEKKDPDAILDTALSEL